MSLILGLHGSKSQNKPGHYFKIAMAVTKQHMSERNLKPTLDDVICGKTEVSSPP